MIFVSYTDKDQCEIHVPSSFSDVSFSEFSSVSSSFDGLLSDELSPSDDALLWDKNGKKNKSF